MEIGLQALSRNSTPNRAALQRGAQAYCADTQLTVATIIRRPRPTLRIPNYAMVADVGD